MHTVLIKQKHFVKNIRLAVWEVSELGWPYNFTEMKYRKEGWTSTANYTYTLPRTTNIDFVAKQNKGE